MEVTSKKEVHFLDTPLATSNVSLHAYNMIATSKRTLLAEERGSPPKKIVVYVDSMEPGAMAALPAQPALFQDTRIRPGRLEPELGFLFFLDLAQVSLTFWPLCSLFTPFSCRGLL